MFKTTTNVNGSNVNAGQPYNPAFFDFTFRHFFASEGIHGGLVSSAGNVGGGHRTQQQRPSLAPLIEQAATNNNDNVEHKSKNNVNATVSTNTNFLPTQFAKNIAQPISTKKTLAPLAPTQSINTTPDSFTFNTKYNNRQDHGTINEHSDYEHE